MRAAADRAATSGRSSSLSLSTRRGEIWWVAADLGLVVSVDLEFHGGPPFSRAAMGTLANTIEDTLRELARLNPAAWRSWREAHGDQPVSIQLMAGQLPDETPAFRFVGLGPTYDLHLADPERLQGLTPDEVHGLMGEALAMSMLARLQPPSRRGTQRSRPRRPRSSCGADVYRRSGRGRWNCPRKGHSIQPVR